MPEKVDRAIQKVMRESGVSKAAAIRILKSQGVIRQRGAHLVAGKRKGK